MTPTHRQAARAGNIVHAMLQYRRKLERGELAPVMPAASFLFSQPPPKEIIIIKITPVSCFTSVVSTTNFSPPSPAEGSGDSSNVLHSDGEDIQHHPHPRH